MSRERAASTATTRDLLCAASTATDEARRTEFREMFEGATSGAHFYSRLKSRALKGLKASALRSVYWMVFLQVLNPTGTDTWLTEIRRSREEYARLQRENTVQLSTEGTAAPDLKLNNPLSLAKDSPWSQYWQDSELTASIRLDLERTYPDHEFFQGEAIQAAMLNILFIWAKLNPTYGYRQGMNEILAPMMLVFHRDARKKLPEDGDDDLLTTLLDDRYMQNDVYACFRKVMVIMGQYFGTKPVPMAARAADKKPHSVGVTTSIFADPEEHKPPPESPIVTRCNHIHHTLLGQCDPGLYAHLQRIGIQPQLYLLRWVRLLFSREFHIEDVTTLWDAIFAYNDVGTAFSVTIGFQLVDYICIAMCLFVRSSLLEGDESFCLSRFLKFPPVEDIGVFVERALILVNPRTYAPLPPAIARAHGEEPQAGGVTRTPYQAIGPSVVHDYRETAAAASASSEDSAASMLGRDVAAAGKKLVGALTKLNPFGSKPSASSSSGARGKYAATITHHSPSASAAAPYTPSFTPPVQHHDSGVSGPLSATHDKRMAAMNHQIAQLTKLMGVMGDQLDGIVARMLKAHAESEDKKIPYSSDLVLHTVAEVKQVRDVLCGRLSPEEVLAHLQAAGKIGGPPAGPHPSHKQPPAASSASSASSTAASASADDSESSSAPALAAAAAAAAAPEDPLASSPPARSAAAASAAPAASPSSSDSSAGASSSSAATAEPEDSLFGSSSSSRFSVAPAVSSSLRALMDDDVGDADDSLFGTATLKPIITPTGGAAATTSASPPPAAAAPSSSAASAAAVSLFGADDDPLFGGSRPKFVARANSPL